MKYPYSLNKFVIMFFFQSRVHFFSSKCYNEVVQTLGRGKKMFWTKFLGPFGRIRSLDVWNSVDQAVLNGYSQVPMTLPVLKFCSVTGDKKCSRDRAWYACSGKGG